uniref:Uncharacterized protein n=1 Tax=Setaria viridis TaxID=4556 RepID=A0A4U6URU0_SETVI|nr:hypothetical protein SEVIR_4G009601v2 [Setaria viridis]
MGHSSQAKADQKRSSTAIDHALDTANPAVNHALAHRPCVINQA